MDAVAEIKSKLDPVEYIGRSVRLTKSGRNFKGLCPFHSEKTPSFYVFPDRGTWRCFGSCGEGGDVFTFVQKRENGDFRDALRVLARDAGVELTAGSAEQRSRLERLASLVSTSVDYYQQQLQRPEAAPAREYLELKRGILAPALAVFHIGWAPDTWRGLRDFLTSRGYDDSEMIAAGMLVQPESGAQPYDRFRGRIIIPITDERGVFIGMGGRGLHGEEPKYLNSPQSDLFDKGRTLYGLQLAGKEIRETGVAVVVEGYMDVIGPWQAGFRNVVASMGTSLTERHAALLRRFTKKVVLAMDPDAAGLAAAERAGGLLLSLESPEAMARSARSADAVTEGSDLDLRVAPLPPGKDPDDITREDPEIWRNAIDNARPFTEFLISRTLGSKKPDSASEARRVVDRLRPILNTVKSPVERGTYIQRIARFLDVSEQFVLEQSRPSMRRMRMPIDTRPAIADRELQLLGLCLIYPELRSALHHLPIDLFNSAEMREAFRRWLDGADLLAVGAEDPLQATIAAARGLSLLRHPMTREEAVQAVQAVIQGILRERLIQRQAAMTDELAEAERTLGSRAVAEVSFTAWQGDYPADSAMSLAQLVIEELELGLSIHRNETLQLR